MVTRREWYERTNAEWPAAVPALTEDEAVKAVKKLYRFVAKRSWKGDLRVMRTSEWTKNYRAIRFGRDAKTGRQFIRINVKLGWRELVHDLSHWMPWHLGMREENSHGAAHARLEARMIREVVRRGWLDGKLRPVARAPRPRPDPREEKRRRTVEAIARWESKERRAANALKKLRRSLAAMDRARAKRDDVAA